MPVHVVIDIKIKDPERYSQYLQKVAPIVKRFGGRYLVRGGRITSLSGAWKPERLIVLEFDTVERVREWLSSPEYAEVAPLREASTVSNAVIVESDVLP